MERHLSPSELAADIDNLVEGVAVRGDDVVIECDGEPRAAVISMSRYRELEAMPGRGRDCFWQIVDEIHEYNKDVPYEVIQAEVDAAVREVRGKPPLPKAV